MVFSRLFTIVFASVALFFTCQVHASQSVNLAWDPNSEPDLAGYRVYFGTGSDNYTQTMEVETPSATVPDLTEGVVYYFAVTAYNTEGVESGYSNEVSYAVPTPSPSPPLIQSATAADNSSSSTISATYSNNNTSGTLLIALVSGDDLRWHFCQQYYRHTRQYLGAGNSWRRSGDQIFDIWYAMNAASGANTVTVNYNATSLRIDV